MATPLHTEIKNIAQNNPAGYISIDLIRQLTVDTMLAAIDKLKGIEIPVGQQVLSASLEDASFATPPNTSAVLDKFQNALGNQIGLKLNSDLTVIVNTFIKGDRTKGISTVTVVVQNIMLLASYAGNIVSFEGVDFTPPTPVFTRDPNADKNLKDAGIDPREADRVEGLIAYSAVNSCISANLGQKKDLILSTLFPPFDFGTNAKLLPLGNGKFLGIFPSSFMQLNSSAVCRCGSGPDLGITQSAVVIDIKNLPPNPQAGTQLGQVTIGAPVPDNLDPLKDFGLRFNGVGLAGIYLPPTASEALTVQIMPAIEVTASDDGFIGFDAQATVGFHDPVVSLDAKNGGIILSVQMDVSVQATCNINIGCGIRLPIGVAVINPAPGSNANFVIGFYPSVDQSGVVSLKGTLQSIDPGSYVAVVLGVGTALEIIGVTAWIGFLIDVVLSAILSYELPSALRDTVKKYIGQNQWQLLNFGQPLRNIDPADRFAAPFDVDGNTMLVSIGFIKV